MIAVAVYIGVPFVFGRWIDVLRTNHDKRFPVLWKGVRLYLPLAMLLFLGLDFLFVMFDIGTGC